MDWKLRLNSHGTVGGALEDFYTFLREQVKENIRLKTPKNFKFPQWVSPALKNIFEKKATHKLLKSGNIQNNYRSNELQIKFGQLRRECKTKARSDYARFIEDTEECLSKNPNFFWPFIKDKKNEHDIPESMFLNDIKSENGQNIVEMFASKFSAIYSKECVCTST